ncbi:MAG: hypothetical protein AB3N21_18295 [Ruegeria sp.]|uniref:FitA-like ribbon-helix-helix domain-containing protein n=1 Tax=Ruegeria sp. TaxID=1879320 RepID=UPI00349E69C1
MANLTIRNLPDEVYRRLKLLAKQNERSIEVEARTIISASVLGEVGKGLGAQMRATWGANVGGRLEIKRSDGAPRDVDFE